MTLAEFYDTQPTGENHEVDYRDPTDVDELEEEIRNGTIDPLVQKFALWIRTKMWRRHVREALARMMEWTSVLFNKIKAHADETREISQETQERQTELEERYDKQIAGNTDISELIDARDSEVTGMSFTTLKRRLGFADSVLFSQVPSGFKFIIEHDSEYQPDIKVTSYRNALGVERDGLDTGPVFGGETIYNVPTQLSYDRKKAYIEMPLFYALNGDISIPLPDTLLIISGVDVLCFKISGATIKAGGYPDEEPTTLLRAPRDLEVTPMDDNSVKLSWKRGA